MVLVTVEVMIRVQVRLVIVVHLCSLFVRHLFIILRKLQG